ncbi:cadherin-like protein 26 isoform X2 [Stigmatopora nigra]
MRTISIPLLVIGVVVTSTLTLQKGHNIRLAKQDILIRTKRRWSLTTIQVVEEDPGPFPKFISQIFNDKSNQYKHHKYVLRGMGIDDYPTGVFSLDERTGKLYAHKSIDREKHNFFHIKFDILDMTTGGALDMELAFDVEIQDINDNAPRFVQPKMNAEVRENIDEGYLPVTIEVIDLDQQNTPNSTVTLSIISQSPQEPKFDLHQIDERSANLTFKGCFDYDKVKMYEIILQAKDHGNPPLSSTAVVTLNITDANSHPPMFKAKTYHGEVPEMIRKENVLRLEVEDKDTPKTPGWRAKYFIINGNEEKNYKIETDPDTNEGILSVVKGKDFEKTAIKKLYIRVENEEPLFVCKDASSTRNGMSFSDSINVTVKVIDVNDPPQFEKESVEIYEDEEGEPGKLLYTPKVHDVDSDISKIRFVLLDDPAKWVRIDEKTGQITTTKKMDRESPFVHDDIYKILIAAIDDGQPPGTSTSTILIHLEDINDNHPKLKNNIVSMCGNKVKLYLKDIDLHPYSGPFKVSLKTDDAAQLKQWKLDPATGEEIGLFSLKTLPYGTYSVPLLIKDQQGMTGEDIVVVNVCNCEGGQVCRHKQTLSTTLGPSGIGLIVAALLLFLLILFILTCKCKKKFQNLSEVQDAGYQTLKKYNEEGGGAICKIEPTLLRRPKDFSTTEINVLKQEPMQTSKRASAMIKDFNNCNNRMMVNSNMASVGHHYHTPSSLGNIRGSFQSQQIKPWLIISERLNKNLPMIDSKVDENHPEYRPHQYVYEGDESRLSLDELSFSNFGDSFLFLNDLGPNFEQFGRICNQLNQEKSIQI